MTEQFDVFLCHNSEDKPQVKEIGEKLKEYSLKPWLDIWELRPGHSWQDTLEEKIEEIHAVAVFVGKNGFGPWQKQELKAYLREFVNRNCPVIPVLLSDAPEKPQLPVFLRGLTWVDFRTSDPDPMDQLIWGITGKKPQLTNSSPSSPASLSSPTSQSPPLPVSLSPQGFTQTLLGDIELEMIKIPAGSFLMGTEVAEVIRLCKEYGKDWYKCEMPQHRVNLQEFYLGKYPVTQEQYQAIMGGNPSNFTDNPKNPVEKVSWDDAQAFCRKLSEKTKKNYRLPSEAEWEYACRAGTQTRYYFGDDEKLLGEYAWYDENSGRETHPVGQKKPNNWGLYDMSGNVGEWCEDGWHENYENAPTDGTAWNENHSVTNITNIRVLRGGSWFVNPWDCRSACRYYYDNRYNDLGFRVVSPQDS
jgi:formylglycine-generating enzyme required for sulfatase activity